MSLGHNVQDAAFTSRLQESCEKKKLELSMIEQLPHLMVNSGAAWVLWLLFALSFLSVAIAFERLLAFRRTHGNVNDLVPALRRLLRTDDHDSAAKLLADSNCVEG